MRVKSRCLAMSKTVTDLTIYPVGPIVADRLERAAKSLLYLNVVICAANEEQESEPLCAILSVLHEHMEETLRHVSDLSPEIT